jgi:hypothetical protein
VSRRVDAGGEISLAGFSRHVGAAYAGEPAGAVVTGGLAGILHAGVVVAARAQRFRGDQAGRAPRARTAIDVCIAAGSVQLPEDGQVIRIHPVRRDRSREPGAFASPKGAAPAQEPRPRRHRLTAGGPRCRRRDGLRPPWTSEPPRPLRAAAKGRAGARPGQRGRPRPARQRPNQKKAASRLTIEEAACGGTRTPGAQITRLHGNTVAQVPEPNRRPGTRT